MADEAEFHSNLPAAHLIHLQEAQRRRCQVKPCDLGFSMIKVELAPFDVEKNAWVAVDFVHRKELSDRTLVLEE